MDFETMTEQDDYADRFLDFIFSGGAKSAEVTDRICDLAYAGLTAMGADPNHPGFPALLSVTATASGRAAHGQDYQLVDLAKEYAGSKRIPWAVVWLDMCCCIKKPGLADAVRMLADKIGAANSKNLGIYSHGEDSL